MVPMSHHGAGAAGRATATPGSTRASRCLSCRPARLIPDNDACTREGATDSPGDFSHHDTARLLSATVGNATDVRAPGVPAHAAPGRQLRPSAGVMSIASRHVSSTPRHVPKNDRRGRFQRRAGTPGGPSPRLMIRSSGGECSRRRPDRDRGRSFRYTWPLDVRFR